MFKMLKIGVGSHDAIISHNRGKVSKERMINRASNISIALKTTEDMPRGKAKRLEDELRGILTELDARSEAVEEIMSKIT